MRWILLFLLPAGLAAQSEKAVSLWTGFKIGAPINDPPFRNQMFSSFEQGRWRGGPTAEVRLPYGFAVAFDVLFRTYRERWAYPVQTGPEQNPYSFSGFKRASAWDLPLQLKYRFRAGPVRPFLSAGYQWTRESSENATLFLCQGTQGSCRSPEFPMDLRGGFSRDTLWKKGAVAGAGIEFRTRRVTIAPEVRFTSGSSRDSGLTGLVGFTFGRK